MKGELKRLLDSIEKSEREAIQLLGIKREERKRAVRRAYDARWDWIVRHSATTFFRGVNEQDMLLGRDA